MHDLLVVGAGPAGLAVALGAARAGLDVLVCERRTGPIDKACGEGLMPAAVRALAALGIDPPGHDIRGIAYRRGPAVARAEFRSGPGRGVRRTALQTALRAAVDAAGIPVLDHRVSDVRQQTDRVVVDGMCARYVVGADGLHSAIRRAAEVRVRPAGRHRWGLRRHYAVRPETDFVEVHWADHAEAYVTPVSADLIGVAILSSDRIPYHQQLARFPELARRLTTPASEVRGAGPLRQRVAGRVAGRVLLVGDAAGYVDALTGEGIAVSLAAAAELVRCVARGRPADYERAWARVSWRSRLITSGLLWARRSPMVARAVAPTARRLPGVFAAAVNQLAG